jgi:hypothetical protein
MFYDCVCSAFSKVCDSLQLNNLVTPNVKVFGISVPSKFMNLLGLGFSFIPSNPIFSKDSAFVTLHHVCHKLYKESIPREDYWLPRVYTRPYSLLPGC